MYQYITLQEVKRRHEQFITDNNIQSDSLELLITRTSIDINDWSNNSIERLIEANKLILDADNPTAQVQAVKEATFKLFDFYLKNGTLNQDGSISSSFGGVAMSETRLYNENKQTLKQEILASFRSVNIIAISNIKEFNVRPTRSPINYMPERIDPDPPVNEAKVWSILITHLNTKDGVTLEKKDPNDIKKGVIFGFDYTKDKPLVQYLTDIKNSIKDFEDQQAEISRLDAENNQLEQDLAANLKTINDLKEKLKMEGATNQDQVEQIDNLEGYNIDIEANIEKNKKAIENINNQKIDPAVILNKIKEWHIPLKMDRLGVYKDMGGNISNVKLKALFQSLAGSNNEYVILREIMRHATFSTINEVEQIGLIEGNWLIDHLKAGQGLTGDFKVLAGVNKINILKIQHAARIHFYKDDQNIFYDDYNFNTENFTQNITKIKDNLESEKVRFAWINDEPVLTDKTPALVNNQYKNLGNTFKLKGNITGDLENYIPLFTAFIKKSTGEGSINTSGSSHINLLSNNTDIMSAYPVSLVQTGNELKVRIQFKNNKTFTGGHYELLMNFKKTTKEAFNLWLTDNNLEFRGGWYYRALGTQPLQIGYETSKSAGTDYKKWFRGNGRDVRFNILIANNGSKLTVLRPTIIYNDDEDGKAETHDFVKGHIKSKNGANVVNKYLEFKIKLDNPNNKFTLEPESFIIMNKVKGPTATGGD